MADLTDGLVRDAQQVFLPAWDETRGNDGYVSFELDPLLEDPKTGPPHKERVAKYIELGRKWSAGHRNRMIKVPATPAGLDAIEELAAAGVTLNVTLVFSSRQYRAARDAMWRGAAAAASLERFKSVYSIFVSRLDVYTEKHVPEACRRPPRAWSASSTPSASGLRTSEFWKDHRTPLSQEMIFASTGHEEARGSALEIRRGVRRQRHRDEPARHQRGGAEERPHVHPSGGPIAGAGRLARNRSRLVDIDHLEQTLMEEGIKKFTDPQKALLKLISEKRGASRRRVVDHCHCLTNARRLACPAPTMAFVKQCAVGRHLRTACQPPHLTS